MQQATPKFEKISGDFTPTDPPKFNGSGKYTISPTEYYKGDFVNSLKQGQGKYQYSKNSYYEGEFLND